MTNAIAKKIIATALTIATLTGGFAASTTATVVTTTVAMSALSATPAAAAVCFSHEVQKTRSSAGAVAKFRKRRAERRAIQAWEDDVERRFGGQYADFDRAIRSNLTFGFTKRGNTSATAFGIVTVCH